MTLRSKAIKKDDYLYEIAKDPKLKMKVPVQFYASEKIFDEFDDGVFEQIVNVSKLPGIIGHAMVMPDAHWDTVFQ